jgi:hypothetical protein
LPVNNSRTFGLFIVTQMRLPLVLNRSTVEWFRIQRKLKFLFDYQVFIDSLCPLADTLQVASIIRALAIQRQTSLPQAACLREACTTILS